MANDFEVWVYVAVPPEEGLAAGRRAGANRGVVRAGRLDLEMDGDVRRATMA